MGKSTLLQNAAPTSEWQILSMDDLDTLDQAKKNPAALLAGKSELIIDEIQKAPQLLSEVKRIVDRNHRNVHFVLSGSANLLLMEQVSETLAGRAVFMTLDTMTFSEALGREPTGTLSNLLRENWPAEAKTDENAPAITNLMLHGFLPPVLFLSSHSAVLQW
ncbi:MAG: AAA family ATPase, partial [bacterium]